MHSGETKAAREGKRPDPGKSGRAGALMPWSVDNKPYIDHTPRPNGRYGCVDRNGPCPQIHSATRFDF